MLHAVTGKPGAGKSYWATRLIVQMLVGSKHQVVTNVPLKLGELNAYMQEHYPRWADGVLDRVTLLAEEEVSRFWCHRGQGEVRGLRHTVDGKGQKKEVQTEFAPDEQPVFYVLDEFHLWFNARAWASLGPSAIWYASQHRKLGDEVYWITQYPGNVDKQFRVLTQDWTYLRNWSQEVWFGGIRPPKRVHWRTFPEEVGEKAGSEPHLQGLMSIDVTGLARCYDTAAGSGIHATLADTGRKGKGVRWWIVVPLAAAVLLAAVWFVPGWVSRGIRGATDKVAQGLMSGAGEAEGGGGGSVLAAAVLPVVAQPVDRAVQPPVAPVVPQVSVNGICPVSGGFVVSLTNGEVLGPRDRRLLRVDRRAGVVEIEGIGICRVPGW